MPCMRTGRRTVLTPYMPGQGCVNAPLQVLEGLTREGMIDVQELAAVRVADVQPGLTR